MIKSLLGLVLLLGLLIVDSRRIDGLPATSPEPPQRRQKFSIEQLLDAKFPNLISGDLDLDVCKAG